MFKAYLKERRDLITEGNSNNGICFDGVVDEIQYFQNEKRLMFLLKETNGNENNGVRRECQSDWDYMEWVHKQAENKEPLYRSVYRNIAMWARMFAIQSKENRDPDIRELIDSEGLMVNELLLDSLKEIAVVNLKKSWGVEATDWKQMKLYLEDSGRVEILRYQVGTLKPTVVLCGGTFDFAKQIFGKECPVSKSIASNGQDISLFKVGETTFVGCYHPSKPGWSRVDSFHHMKNILEVVL